MNTNQIQQPPTFIPPPQQYMPGPTPAAMFAASKKASEKEVGKRIQVAFLATVAFVVLSNPIAYRIMNQVYMAFTGHLNEIMLETGIPSGKGVFLHTVIFFLFMLFILLKK